MRTAMAWAVAISASIAGAGLVRFDTDAGEAKVTILEQNSSGTTFEVSVPVVETTTVLTDSGVFTRLGVPGGRAGRA